MGMKRIETGWLEVGKPLPASIYDEDNNLLLARGMVLASEKQLGALIKRGMYVDESKMARAMAGKGNAPVEGVYEDEGPEIETVGPIDQLSRVRRELAQLYATKPITAEENFTGKLLGLAARVANVCQKHPEASLAATLHDRESRYPIRHMIHVAIVSDLVAEGAGLGASERFSIISAALTMNIAMLDLQERLNQSAGMQLTDQQREAIKKHPEMGVRILNALGVNDQLWMTLVWSHHEAMDGSGYPRGLKGPQIPIGAQIINLADGYTARLERRADRDAISPNQSLREIFLNGGKGVDPKLAAILVKRVGIYPPGMIVELESGEYAVVTRRTDNASAPEVHCFMSRERAMYQKFQKRDTTSKGFAVKGVVSLEAVKIRINPLQFWGG